METVEQLVSFNHIHVQLQGGAPWGFTLKGGLEHGEPLIITKIEDGGKASQTKKLRVGDELININGSALYGSRQEALILIKGSYRTLKITVRRRSVPCRRPHSWHVTKQAEPLSVTSTSDSPLDMQLYPAPFPTIWHSSNNNSDLSMPWRPLSRHHSNSGGSMESLETPPSQSYYDSQLSPVDPVIFHNKRDSAYSSFSASSNTSDYTVSLRPDDASSMDNILQGLGSGRPEGRPPSSASGPGDLQEEPGGLKSRLVFLRPEAKIRPSSYSYEDEHRGPPQPPARKDSFRATRARPGVLDKRCISAPVGIPSPSGYLLEEQQRRHTFSEKPVFENGTMETWRDSKGGSLEPYYIITSDSELYTHHRQNKEGKVNVQENHFENLQKGSPGPVLQQTESLTTGSVAEKPSDVHLKPESNHLFGSDQYSDAEHQLAPQGQQLEFCNNQSDSPSSGSSKWSQNLLQAPEEQGEPSSPDSLSSNKWNGSRSSTPGSSVLPKWEKPSMDTETLNSTQIPLSSHLVWGRSISVPGEQVNGFCSTAQSALSYSSTLEQQFKPISSAVSIGTLLEESQEQTGQGKREEDEGLKSYKKSSSSRQFRSSKSRRRDERFATNLRNEIQRIKAGLQKSKSPDGFLNCDETLKEEESGDLQAEREDTLKRGEILLQSSEIQPSVYRYSPQVTHSDREELPPSGQNSKSALTSSCHLHQPLVSPPRNKGSSGPDTACIVEHLPPKLDHGRKGEEGTNASKSRRWRFTPEHKLQPETDQAEKKWRKGELLSSSSGQSSWHQRSNPPTLTRSSSRTSVESDILPFADRRKFFEETSRNLSNSVSNLSKLNVHQPKLERQWCQSNPSSQDMAKPASQLPFRRFSYQGGLPQEGLFRPGVEGRRHFVNESVERNRGKDRMYESTEERELEKLREAAREKERELEELREREREMALERERKREKEIESELLQRKWEMERDLDSKMDSLQLTEKHNMYNREKWEMGSESSWHGQSFYSNSPPKPVIQDPRSRPQYSQSLQLSHCYQTNGHAESDNICSAFDPVGVPVHPKTQCSPREYILRSCTPTEAYPVSEREQTKLNRKFSLTERDYVQYRPDFRLVNGAVYQGLHSQRRNRIPVSSFVPSPLRSRAMSENNLCMEPWCSPKGAMSDAQDLKEEGRDFSSLRKPKALPPPRPPPPKWDQFYRRRASHHSLFPSSTPPQSSPLQFQPQGSPPSPLSAPEVTRQRAYSLPPREVPVSCPPRQERSLAPFSTNPSQSVFRPVAPAPKEKVTPFIAPEQHTRLCDAGTPLQEDQSQPAVLRPVSWKHKSFAEWDHSSTQEQCRTASAPGVPPDAAIKQEHSSYEKEPVPESYFTIDNLLPQQPQQQQQQQQYQQQRRGSGTLQVCYRQLESPQICTEPAGQEPDAPMETDIDDLTEEETMEDCTKPEVPVEMQCFACPITVLETDVDVPPPQKEDQKVEAFPVENLPVEHSGDSPERSSRLSSEGMQAHGSTYTSTSTANPQPLIQMKPCLIMNNSEQDEELNYKRQLMESLRKKLGVLQDAQRGLQEDIRANSQLGEEIEALVMTVCKPNEVDKFRMFIGDLEKVVSLRLSLSGRLLRVESALDCLDVETGHHERLPLLEKKQQLLLQLGEAQELKEHVDRREEAVGRVLSSCLTQEQLRDYKHFVKMKAALLVEQRQLDDKIRLGEEQLRGLRESLGPGSALHYGY